MSSQLGTGSTVDWNNESASKNLTKDTGTTTGDVIFILVSWYENGGSNAAAITGFTRNDLTLGGSGGNRSLASLYHRVSDGSEGATFAMSFSPFAVFGTAILHTQRGSGALSIADGPTAGTAASSTTCTAPDLAGSNGQTLVTPMGVGDPTTMTTPTGMTAGTVGLQNSNTGRFFFQNLTVDVGTKASTLGTSRDNGAWSILLNDAGGGAAANVLLPWQLGALGPILVQ